MSDDLIVRNATLPDGRTGQDIAIRAGRIAAIGPALKEDAPRVLDAAGQVVGLTLAEAPRRGRIYAASGEAIRAAMAKAGARPSSLARGEVIDVDNYGRVADTLRRDLRVARVVCLAG